MFCGNLFKKGTMNPVYSVAQVNTTSANTGTYINITGAVLPSVVVTGSQKVYLQVAVRNWRAAGGTVGAGGFRVIRDGATVITLNGATFQYHAVVDGGTTADAYMMAWLEIDNPGPGTYSYQVQMARYSGTGNVTTDYQTMIARVE